MRIRTRVLASVTFFALVFGLPTDALPQATPYVPTLDVAYQQLNALVSAGLVRDALPAQRPYSRMAFARAVTEARVLWRAEDRSHRPRLEEALTRLEQRFSEEVSLLCNDGPGECPAPEPYVALRQAAFDGTWADSPPRDVPTGYSDGLDLPISSRIDATVNPLLQGPGGRTFADGWTLGGEGVLDLVAGSRVAAQLQPRAWLSSGDASGLDVTLVRGYARSLLGNLAVVVGRLDVPHGNTRNYGPVLSFNARGMDMIRLSMERPARLPWIFRHLGTTAFTASVADMGRDQDTPGSKLFTIEGLLRPHPNLTLGLALLNHQMGEGAPEASWGQRLRDILFLENRRFLPFSPIPSISDKVLAFDAQVTIPSIGTSVYVEVMTTDDHNLFSSPETGLGTEAAWTGGFRVVGLGPAGRWDLWAEGSRNGVRPYTHHEFTSGLTLDRRILGNPLGPLATGLTAGLDWTGTSDRVSISGSWERYQGDTYHNVSAPATDWVRTVDNPDESRLRTTLDWTREPDVTGVRTAIRLGYERVTRFDFTTLDRNNVLAQLAVGYIW